MVGAFQWIFSGFQGLRHCIGESRNGTARSASPEACRDVVIHGEMMMTGAYVGAQTDPASRERKAPVLEITSRVSIWRDFGVSLNRETDDTPSTGI